MNPDFHVQQANVQARMQQLIAEAENERLSPRPNSILWRRIWLQRIGNFLIANGERLKTLGAEDTQTPIYVLKRSSH